MVRRLGYIDGIKGFAITLMVMGHVIAWMFDDWRVLISTPSSPALLWNFIYSFHMPLFIFVSGYLFGRKQINGYESYLKYVGRKFLSLLTPFFVMGIVVHYYYAFVYGKTYHWFAYWYLLTLFQLISIVGFVELFSMRIRNKKVKFATGIVFLSVAYCAVKCICAWMPKVCAYAPMLAFLDVWRIQGMFWPFVLGMLLTRYDINIPKCIDSVKGFWGCFFMWGISFALNFPNISKWFGISAAFLAFRNISWINHDAIKHIGRMSLSIYILHLFLRCPFLFVGKWLTQMSCEYGFTGRIYTLPVQLIVSLLISLAIILACVALDRLIVNIPVIRTLVLGLSGTRVKDIS